MTSPATTFPREFAAAWAHALGLLVFAAIVLPLTSCRSASNGAVQQVSSDTVWMRIIPGATPAALRVVTEQRSVPLLSGSTETELRILSADSTMSRYRLDMTSMGAPGKTETLTSMITADIPAGALANALEMSVRTTADSKERIYAVSAEIDTAALELMPSVTRQNDGTYQFLLRATRRRIVPGEYFPSSEQLRIAIFNGKGATVWSSNDGMAFLTVVMPVEPALQGASHLYTLDWNAMASDGVRLPSGRYRVQLTLPARPAPYTCFLDVVLP